MPAKILELPKTETPAAKSQDFSSEGLTPMPSSEGGIPASKGPTEEQIAASGWFAPVEGADTTKIVDKPVKVASGEKQKIEDQLESSEKKTTEGELTKDESTDEIPAKTEGEEKSDLPDFLKPPKEKVASGEEGKQVDKPVAGKIAGKAFDYTGYTVDEAKHLKNMDKFAREFTAGLIKKSKEVVTQETSYLQHPNGYMLAPEYQAAQANLSSMTQQYNHWKQQLLNARDGKNVQDIDTDEKTGKMVITGEFKPNDQIEELCRENMMLIQQKAEQERAVIATFPTRFKQTLSKDIAGISEALAAECPWVAKPELLNYRMDVKFKDGQTRNVSLGELKQTFINQFPPYMRSGNIGIEIAANAWVGMLIHQKSAETASSGKKAAEIKTAEGRRAEPSGSGKRQEVKKVGGVSEFSTVNAGIEFGQ